MKTWFITGCSSGFGRYLADAVLARGDQAVISARNPATLDDLVRRHPEHALAVKLDVTKQADIVAAMAATEARFGRLDVLVNNAGYGMFGAVEETSPEEYRPMLETNFFGLLETTRAALPMMRPRGGGRIVNISSIGGFYGGAGFGLYAASKFAVEGLSEALSKELEPFGIKIIIVEPGSFRTDFLGRSIDMAAHVIDGYEETSGQMRRRPERLNGLQPGDPTKAVAVMIEAVDSPEPPLRLPLGNDAFDRAYAKLDHARRDFEMWEAKGRATGFVD